jgi:hypothetical protein
MSGLARMLSWLGPGTRQPIQPRLNKEEILNKAKTLAQQAGSIGVIQLAWSSRRTVSERAVCGRSCRTRSAAA